MVKQAFAHLSLLLLGILPLVAQADSRSISGRSAWFACTSLPDGMANPVKVMCGETITEVLLPRYMASDPVKIPADGIIRIVREALQPDPEKAAVPGFDRKPVEYIVLARAMVPENIREALIILTPLAEPEGNLIFSAKVQNLANFKGGDRLYINQSKAPVRVTLGDDQVLVDAGESKIYESPDLAKPTNTQIIYNVYDPEGKRWKLFSASTVVIRPTRRRICIFNSGSRPGNIKKHAILFPVANKN